MPARRFDGQCVLEYFFSDYCRENVQALTGTLNSSVRVDRRLAGELTEDLIGLMRAYLT